MTIRVARAPALGIATVVLGLAVASGVLAQSAPVINVTADDKGPVSAFAARRVSPNVVDANAVDQKGPVAFLPTDHFAPVANLVNTTNGGAVSNGGQSVTFSLTRPFKITLIQTYHWNNARGQAPAAGSIGMRNLLGQTWHFTTTGAPGSGGVPNAFYNAYPGMIFPAGTYTIIDDTATWSCNAQSGGRGFVLVQGQQMTW
jgi:hypothetical protein